MKDKTTIAVDRKIHGRIAKIAEYKNTLDPSVKRSVTTEAHNALEGYAIAEEIFTGNKVLKKTHKLCIRCKAVKPLADFDKHPQAGDGLHPYCKQCRSQINKNGGKI